MPGKLYYAVTPNACMMVWQEIIIHWLKQTLAAERNNIFS